MPIIRKQASATRRRRAAVPGRHRLRRAASPGRHRLRRAAAAMSAAAALAGLAPLLAPATAASAGNLPAPVVTSLGSDTVFTNDGSPASLVTVTLQLQADEARTLVGQVDLTSKFVVDTQVGIRCLAPDGTQAGPAEWTSRNYNGESSMALSPSLLLVAGSAGTYTCQLLAAADEPTTSSVTMTALASGTWLQADSANDPGAAYWDEPSCDSAGQDPNCVYIGQPWTDSTASNPAPPQTRILPLQIGVVAGPGPFGGDPPPQSTTAPSVFTAADDATTIDLGANIEMTTCDHGTASCPDGSQGTTYEQGVSSGTNVTTSLQAVQLNTSGQGCRGTTTAPLNSFVDNNSHHYNVHLSLSNVQVSATCGTRMFDIDLVVTWDSGNPIKIDGERPSANESETQAYAFDSTITSAVTVPSVTGATVADAERTLATHNLSTGTVTGVVSSQPVNSVIAQNAAAGTSEPAGSVVNLTYSEGAVTVPDVTNDEIGTAEGILTGDGLHYSVTDVTSCAEPNEVISQSPGGQSVVAAGATIALTVGQCSSPPPGGGGSGNPIQPE